MSSEDIQKILLGLVGILVGYLLKYYLDKKQQFATKNAELKREAYFQFIEFMMDIMSQNQVGVLSAKQMVQRLNPFFAKHILYASPEVVNSYGDFMQYLYTHSEKIDTKTLIVYMTTVFRDMRKDVGLSNKNIGHNGERLVRGKFNDYEKIMSPNFETQLAQDPSFTGESAPQILKDKDISVLTKVKSKKKNRKKRK